MLRAHGWGVAKETRHEPKLAVLQWPLLSIQNLERRRGLRNVNDAGPAAAGGTGHASPVALPHVSVNARAVALPRAGGALPRRAPRSGRAALHWRLLRFGLGQSHRPPRIPCDDCHCLGCDTLPSQSPSLLQPHFHAPAVRPRCLSSRMREMPAPAKPQWFLDLNPNGKIPILERPSASALWDSCAICLSLLDRFDRRRLLAPPECRDALYRAAFYSSGPVACARLGSRH